MNGLASQEIFSAISLYLGVQIFWLCDQFCGTPYIEMAIVMLLSESTD